MLNTVNLKYQVYLQLLEGTQDAQGEQSAHQHNNEQIISIRHFETRLSKLDLLILELRGQRNLQEAVVFSMADETFI